jgi:hypothetical protein
MSSVSVIMLDMKQGTGWVVAIRHSWGVLRTSYGTADEARRIADDLSRNGWMVFVLAERTSEVAS